MTEQSVADQFDALAKAATQGVAGVRTQQYDDWEYVRVDGGIVAMCRAGRFVPEDEKNEHRAHKTDPYEHNAAFIAWCFNNRAMISAALRTTSGVGGVE